MTAGPLAEVTCVRGESFVISGPGGDVLPGGDQGLFVRDTRFVDRLELYVEGAPPEVLSGTAVGADRAIFHAYLPPRPPAGPDATVLITRRREVDGGLHEHVELSNAGEEVESVAVELRLGTDFAYIFDVKHRRAIDPSEAVAGDHGVVFQRPGGGERTELRVEPDVEMPYVEAIGGRTAAIRVTLTIPGRATRTLCLTVDAEDAYGRAAPPRPCRGLDWERPDVGRGMGPVSLTCSDHRFERLVTRSLLDLEGLVLPDPASGSDRFAAAGSPWYLTLFGRDSLWAALMALPFDPDLAIGTLRTLARRQGTREDPETEEAPGKILHEVRRGALAERGDLPPNYYGTVDATPLFVILAHAAWRWGAPEDALAPLLPNVAAALGWVQRTCAEDDDGFLRYARIGTRGLANQGWKDSGDGIRFRDGTIARAPMALAEVQGYAYAAAMRGAELLEALGGVDGRALRDWAADLAAAFRRRFWVGDDGPPYPAVALDAERRTVDSVASNMGHLLFTGMLDDAEARLVGDRLVDPTMDSGWGLRTLSSASGGYNPLSYHCGAVWPHDTAIAVWGLARAGCDTAALRLLAGLLRAAPAFRYRLPELFAGLDRHGSTVPVPYPAACSPQAWAAGGALLLAVAVLGLDADVPARRLSLRPLAPTPFDQLTLRGVPVGDGAVDVRLRHGDVDVDLRGADLEVVVA